MSATRSENPCQVESSGQEVVERAVRKRVLLGAYAAFNDGFNSVPCRVKNISDTGALLHFDSPQSVPSKFVLHIELEGCKIDCITVRKDQNLIAVKFSGEKQASCLRRVQSVNQSCSRAHSLEQKELELQQMLQQSRQQSLQRLHQQEHGAQIEPRLTPVRKGGTVFGKRN